VAPALRNPSRRCLTRACSRQAEAGRRSVRAPHSQWPSSGRVDLCGREDDRLQLMRMSLDRHTGFRPGAILHLRLAIALLLMLVANGLQAQAGEWKSAEHVSTRFSRDSLDGISERGRAIAAYDAAAWHGSDAAMALKPDYVTAPRYLARLRPESGRWEVVFGRLSATRDSFVFAYRAVQVLSGGTLYTATRVVPAEADTGYYVRAARALELAERDFGKQSRPYNSVVLPIVGTAEWFVYLVPAPTKVGYWPLGADVRYRITPDGMSMVAKRRLHNTVLEYGPPKPGAHRLEAGYHSAVVADEPEDTDVFLVLTRQPQVPEYIVSASYYFRIDTDGRITAYDRDTSAR
jgi:hypothetical protein